ncbi:reverse transcriptase domain-containing protein [Tanacetum coccineum]
MAASMEARIAEATGIRLRAASPLLLLAPSSPLPLPATDRREDVPEADVPPRKRLCLTAPTSRFEVGESSTAAAAARQPGSFVARRADYSFVDIVDANIRVVEERAMAAVRVVNLRVSYQADVRWRESEEFYTRHQDVQDDRAAMRRQDADDHATRAMMRIHVLEDRARIDTLEDTGGTSMAVGLKMPPKRNAATTTTTPMTDAQIKAPIAQGVANALAKRDADRIRNQVKYATCTLFGNALTWWNSHVKTVGHDAAYGMPWKTLMKMMTDKYCPRGDIKKLEIKIWNLKVKESDKVEKYVGGLPDMIQGSVMASKPKKMQDAIEFAAELMDQKIHTLAERQAENKRKFEDTSRNNQNQ